MTILRVNTIAGTGTTFGPLLDGNLEFNSQNYIILPKGTSTQEGVLRTTADVVGTGGTFYDNLVLAMPFNAATGLRDVSSRNRNPAAYGNVAISTTQSKYYGSSAYFDGSGDYLTTSSNADFAFETGDYTVEFWVNPNIINPFHNIFDTRGTASNSATGFSIGYTSTYVYVYTNQFLIESSTTISSWIHIAVTRQSGTIKLFINGINSGSYSASTYNFTNSIPYIGIAGGSGTGQTFSGYLQDLRIYKGIAKYTSNFTPPDRIAEVGVGFKTGQLRYNTDSNKVELYDGNQWAEVQSSRPDLNGGARGVFGGGDTGSATGINTLDFITISSTGNAIDFGDLLGNRTILTSCSSSTRGLFGGGSYNGGTDSNVIEFITISSTGNAADFGDLTQFRRGANGCSNSTRGLFAGGLATTAPFAPITFFNIIDYVTIASTGNAVDFGDSTLARASVDAGCSSSTRGLWGGGQSPAQTNNIDYVTISTLGNATDFGDLTLGRGGPAAVSNSTRGVWAGGYYIPSFTTNNIIDYVTISSTGNTVDFGDLTVGKGTLGACSSSTRGVFGGGSVINVIEYITILTQGNAIDFGDLTSARQRGPALSNAHGGL